jgi:hypothetical protein
MQALVGQAFSLPKHFSAASKAYSTRAGGQAEAAPHWM